MNNIHYWICKNHPKIYKYRSLLVSFLIVLIFSICSIDYSSSWVMIISDIVACIILGIPTWIIMDLFLHGLNKFNNSPLLESTIEEDRIQNMLIPKWAMIFGSILIFIACIIFFIKSGYDINLLTMPKHINLDCGYYLSPFVTDSLSYLGFWLIVGVFLLWRNTRFYYPKHKKLFDNFEFLQVWTKPIMSIVSIFGIELTALSALTLHVNIFDHILLYFNYFVPPLTILGVVTENWYDIKNKLIKHSINMKFKGQGTRSNIKATFSDSASIKLGYSKVVSKGNNYRKTHK